MDYEKTLNITANVNAKLRIDKFLAGHLEKMSRVKIQDLIEGGYVYINERAVLNPAYKVGKEDNVIINIPKPKPVKLLPKEDITINIIYEDEHFAIINKPSGLTVHPGNGTHDNTLVHGLIAYFNKNLSSVGGLLRPGIVHRLDKDTSGLMIVAKTDHIHNLLSRMLHDHLITRGYIAFVYGTLAQAKGKIEANIARSRLNPTKMSIVKGKGKKAITNYYVEKIYANGCFSKVICHLETGRTHQIRLHFSHLGHCLIGDKKYGSPHKLPKNLDAQYFHKFSRQALHSFSISFLHPVTNKKIEHNIDLPDDLKELEEHMITIPILR